MEDRLNPIGGIKALYLNEMEMEWTIPDFASLSIDNHYNSPLFSFDDAYWHLTLYPEDVNPFLKGDVSIYIARVDGIYKKSLHCTFGIKDSTGKVVLRNSHFFDKNMTFACLRIFQRSKLLKIRSELPGTLVISFSLKYEIPHDIELTSSHTRFIKLESLSLNFKDMYTSGRNCDTTIEVGDKKFHAHRFVLIARSSVFDAMFHNDMVERKTGVISIPDCDPESFGIFLEYLYSGKVEDASFNNLLHLYITADKYDVQELKEFCFECMKQDMTAADFCNVIVLADQYDEAELFAAAQEFFKQNMTKVLETSEWKILVENNCELTNKLLSNLAT